MALQNIGASNRDDAFYRYKMPRMTNVVNMVDIAKALARPAAYTTKYFGCELGAQSKFDEKTGVSLVNGAHDTPKLAQLLENFIKKYVQCYGCGNPETEIIITKNQTITLKCAACGFVSDVDMRDKLTTFILKNPPEQKKGTGKDKKAMRRAEKERLKEGEAADEEQKKLKKEVMKKKTPSSSSKDVAAPKAAAAAAASKKKTSISGGGGSDEDRSPTGSQADDNELAHEEDEDDDIQWQTDTSREAAQKRIQEQLSAVTAEMVMLSTDEPPEERKKPSKEKKAEEKKSNGHHHHHIAATEKEDPHAALVKKLRAQLQQKGGTTPAELKASVMGSAAGTPKEAMAALFAAMFDGVSKGLAKEAGKWLKHLAALAQDEASQMQLLQALEGFSGRASPEAVKEVALVLKLLYDEDILEEEVIFWKNVRPFVEWLQNAESESE
ncbi:unnamed protein product [Spirodela intermedia]|uniref:W2 domain-containing protein n=1 Tax=Spirodela intermedia TaxID=51605 RepID=A0A7I8JSH3_SPIIN|nr:unnamed protein product [Spirodela intermedia]CAA6673130.1 unnamed protein product [Spirodela intermedia]